MSEVQWYEAPVHRRWQRHRAHSTFIIDGALIARCSCGAFGPKPWIRLDPWPNRRDRRDRQRASMR